MEALTLMGDHPRPGERCLDLGSSPGGWTWVCAQLGANVVSVDKAELDPRIMDLPNVEHRQASAFALDTAEFASFDWVLSDVICYPPRLLELVEKIRHAGVKRIVCTIKFQGEQADPATTDAFIHIDGARVLHLSHNKHELTFMLNESRASES